MTMNDLRRDADDLARFYREHPDPYVVPRSAEDLFQIGVTGIRHGVQTLFLGKNDRQEVRCGYYVDAVYPTDADGPKSRNLWTSRGWLNPDGGPRLLYAVRDHLERHPHLNVFAITGKEKMIGTACKVAKFRSTTYDELIEMFGPILGPYLIGYRTFETPEDAAEHFRKKLYLLREGR